MKRKTRARSLALTLPLAALLAAVLISGAPLQAAQAVPIPDVPDVCIAIAEPMPSGVTARPNHDFNTFPDYNYVHSSTHLSGKRATEKLAPGLFWHPPAPQELSGFESAIKITNPSTVAGTVLSGQVRWYDTSGTYLGYTPISLAAEASVTLAAQPLAGGSPAGLGSARIVSLNGVEFVGETIHHTDAMNLAGFGGPVVTDPDPFAPGASSMQQLQVAQANKTTLSMGPFPVSDQNRLDIVNGNAPLFWVQNPNPTATTVSVLLVSRLRVSLGSVTVTLPAYTSYLELRLWNLLWGPYLSGSISYDDDFLIYVTADQGILGEFLMADLFGNGSGPGDNLRLGDRFRMGSGMLANSPAARVINPELTFQPASLGIQTVMGILNAGSQNIGPVNVQYRDRNGVVLGNDNIGTLPVAGMVRIGPGLPSSPNYPGTTFDGWVRITACKPGLVGWTMRTGGDEPGASPPVFKKVWGEALSGANGAEPGNGFQVTLGGQSWVRKVGSFVRVDPTWYWPGYVTFLNHSAANVGAYWYRFFRDSGANVTNPAGQPFAGLRFANTSFNYEDPYTTGLFGATNVSERVDHTTGSVQGIHVIGDPLVEWGIFDQIPILVEPGDPDVTEIGQH